MYFPPWAKTLPYLDRDTPRSLFKLFRQMERSRRTADFPVFLFSSSFVDLPAELEEQADIIRESAEEKADRLEEQADRVRESGY